MPFDRALFAKEVVRKSIHMGGFLAPLLYYFFFSREIMLLIVGLGVLAGIALEAVRLSGNPIFPRILLREHEENGVVGGYFYGILSTFLAVLLFDKTIAIASILFLNFGDAITGLAGAVVVMYRERAKADTRTYASRGAASPLGALADDLSYAVHNHKSPFLMGVMFLLCALIGLLFYPSLSLLMIAAGATGSVIADAFPWRVRGVAIDDNLMIPLLSGALMTLAAILIK
jgi:dolichol kinase